MIILGIILLIIGYWFIPAIVPTCPPPLDTLCVGLGWLFLIIGLILLVLSMIGHPVGSRRYWY